jgi:hypothetical protein
MWTPFIEFLKTSGLFDKWVEGCPLHYTSANAPEKRNVLGTLLLSVLAGHWRYAHINAIRGDGINPELLGMTRVASEDSVRRGMKALDEAASGQWMKKHLKASYEPLLLWHQTQAAHRGFRRPLHMNLAREGVQAGNGFCPLISCDFDLTLRVSLNALLFLAHVEQS